jgi:hypothetical protein
MSSYWNIVQSDLEHRTSQAFVLAAFDNGNGIVDTVALTQVISDAEAELQSWLISELGGQIAKWPTDIQSDPFYKISALEYCVAFMVERHPEAAKQAGLATHESYFNRATARAKRIQEGRQRATTATEEPANQGGMTPNLDVTMYVAAPGAPTNYGDF